MPFSKLSKIKLSDIFHNGNRILLAALILPLVATVVTVVVYLTLADSSNKIQPVPTPISYHPLRVDPPFQGTLKVTDRIDGITGPAVHLGQPVHLTQSGSHLCNDTDHNVTLSIAYGLFGTDSNGRFKSINALAQPISLQFPPGCSSGSTRDSAVSLPAEIGIGKWSIQIGITASEDGQIQSPLEFNSEQFSTVD